MLTPDTTHSSAIASVPSDQVIGKLEIVTLFYSAMPIGVTVSRKGCIFISYPRLVDEIEFTVCELTNPHQENGSPVPYPNPQIYQPNLENPSECLLSVQGLTIDARDRLWLLDHANNQSESRPTRRAKANWHRSRNKSDL